MGTSGHCAFMGCATVKDRTSQVTPWIHNFYSSNSTVYLCDYTNNRCRFTLERWKLMSLQLYSGNYYKVVVIETNLLEPPISYSITRFVKRILIHASDFETLICASLR